MRSDIQALHHAFYAAHSNTSFSPEVRADQCVADFSSELDADLAELGDRQGNYAAKYVEHLRTWAARKSRCMSSMITGPSNFPVARAMKANNAEHSAWEEFRAWRKRYIKRALSEPVKSPEAEIDDALARLDAEKTKHALMVGVNKILRKKVDVAEKRRLIAEEWDLDGKAIDEIFTPNVWGTIGYMSYELTNSNARIKSLEEKLIIMRARIQNRDAFEPIAFPGGTIDIEDDRVVIRHDEKPEREIIDALKSSAFHWSPRGKFWCRKHTANAIRDAKRICGVAK